METEKNKYISIYFIPRNIQQTFMIYFNIFFIQILKMIVGAQNFLRVIRTILTKRASSANFKLQGLRVLLHKGILTSLPK